MFTAMVPAQTPISRDHNKKLVKIIQALLVYEESAVFRKPIPHKALGWEDYKEIIKKPIDLNYVRRQYNEGKYKFVEEVLDEIQLVWENVFLYGKKDHESFDMAFKMQNHFDQLLNDFLPEYYQKINRVAYLKQFEPKKPEKKGSNLAAQLRNKGKQQKMDIEPIKQQEKKVFEPQSIISKKKQSLNSKKSYVSHLVDPLPTLAQEVKKQANKNSNEGQTKMDQTKKQLVDIRPQTKPDTQERKKQLTKEIPVIESKKQTSFLNKQTKTQQKNDKIQPEFEVQQPLKSQKQKLFENPIMTQPEVKIQPQLMKIEIPDPIENQQSQQNQIPPILVTLNKSPSEEQINEITNMMNLLFEIQEFETLSKVVRILTKYEKQTMVIDGQDVNFRMNEIHISTFNKIKKEMQIKFYQLETSQKVKQLNDLMTKHNVKSFLSEINSNVNGGEMIEQQKDKKPNEIQEFSNQEHEKMIAVEY